MFNTSEKPNFNYELLVFENEYNPKTTGSVTKDIQPTFREYQTNLLIKIIDFIYLCPGLYNELFVLYKETENATTLEQLYAINDEVDILVENC